MQTLIPMVAALVALAAVVVAKIITLELLAAHHRRYARLQDQLEQARSDLRVAATQRAAAERERRGAEHRRHRANMRLARGRERIDLLAFDESVRQAHFDLLTHHLVDR